MTFPVTPSRHGLVSEARDNAGSYDRLIVFFSGHGEMTFSDADLSQPSTVILPVDFEGHPSERYVNIAVDDLINEFRVAGPREQLFIFDYAFTWLELSCAVRRQYNSINPGC
jgi:hypothetical protein